MTQTVEAMRPTSAAAAAPLLSVNNIEVVYDDVILVLRGLSLEVPKGAIVALLGANGAGKSTTLKAISGLLKTEDGEVTRGDILFDGQRINGIDPDKIVRRGIFQVMEGRRVIADMTSVENLKLGAYTRNDNEIGADIDRSPCESQDAVYRGNAEAKLYRFIAQSLVLDNWLPGR